jgi:hypothetical protein
MKLGISRQQMLNAEALRERAYLQTLYQPANWSCVDNG